MKKQYACACLRVRNHGLFEDFELEIKPLTVFVGRNSVGKSTLLQLAWILLSLKPNRARWLRMLERAGGGRIAEEIVKKATSGEDASEDFKVLVKLALESSLQPIAVSFRRKFENTFPLF